jgi:hypothetical protein
MMSRLISPSFEQKKEGEVLIERQTHVSFLAGALGKTAVM